MNLNILKNTKLLIVSILIIAAILRLSNLDQNPPAAYGDEISFAWNAWNILKTGTDEYGTPYPLHFRAFDDYKAPLPVYLLVPVIKFLGLNIWSVRLLVVFFSVLTILFVYLLGKQLVGVKLGLASALLLTISPWHIHLSRGFFESTIALFWFVAGIYLLSKNTKNKIWLLFSAISFCACLYTYFTPRIILPLFLPFLLFLLNKYRQLSKKEIFIFLIVLFVFSLPLVKLTLFDKSSARLGKIIYLRNQEIERDVVAHRSTNSVPYLVKIFFNNKISYWSRELTNSYLEHFSLNFLYLFGDSSLRYGLGNMGMFYLIEAPFLVLGLATTFKKNKVFFWLLAGWLLISPIPSAISGKPFAVRSLMMVPAIFYFVSSGIIKFWDILKRIIFGNFLKVVLVAGVMISIALYLTRYNYEYPVSGASWWGWENKAAIEYALRNKDAYDRIFLSNFYSGIDLALAFYTKQDPLTYRYAKEHLIQMADNRSFIKLDKFYIGSLDIDKKRFEEKIIPPRSLYIGRPEEVDGQEVITDPFDGRILFKIYKTE